MPNYWHIASRHLWLLFIPSTLLLRQKFVQSFRWRFKLSCLKYNLKYPVYIQNIVLRQNIMPNFCGRHFRIKTIDFVKILPLQPLPYYRWIFIHLWSYLCLLEIYTKPHLLQKLAWYFYLRLWDLTNRQSRLLILISHRLLSRLNRLLSRLHFHQIRNLITERTHL